MPSAQILNWIVEPTTRSRSHCLPVVTAWPPVTEATLVSRPEMESLATTFNETASLAYLFDDRIHVLDCLETFHEIRMTNKIGRVLPPHCSSSHRKFRPIMISS